MQQNIQNSYTLFKFVKDNIKSGGQIQIIIPPGCYNLDCSLVIIDVLTMGSGEFGQEMIYTRTDCFIPVYSGCIIVKDGVQIANYNNLCEAQLQYRQQYMQDHDVVADYNDPQNDVQYPSLTKKRWKRLGYTSGNVADKFSIPFRFKHFFPYIFTQPEQEQKYLFVDKQMIIQIPILEIHNNIYLAYQKIGAAEDTDNSVFQNLKPVIYDPETGENDNPFTFKIYMKKMTMYNYIPRNYFQSFFTQFGSKTGNFQFNLPIQENQVSQYQTLSIIPNNPDYPIPTMFNFEDIKDQTFINLRVQRQGLDIIDATTLTDFKAQSLIWKENYKDDCQNLLIQFNETLSNTNLQMNVQTNLSDIQLIVGLQYFQKI